MTDYEYIERATNVVKVSELHNYMDMPHLVRLDLPKAVKVMPFDVGALAYAIRADDINTTAEDKPQKVVLNSYKAERKSFLVALYDHLAIKNWRDTTVQAKLTKIRIVFDFCDSNNFSNFFESSESFAKAYAAYTNDLLHRIYHQKLKPSSAREMQKVMEDMVEIWKDEKTKYKIVANVSEIKAVREAAVAPDESLVRNAVQVFLAIAREYGQSVLKSTRFPWLLKMPGYETYVFPTNVGPVKTPYTTNHAQAYCYKTGQKITHEQYALNGAKGTERTLRSQLNRAYKNINEINNQGIENYYKQTNATLAMLAYLQLFILMTGAYPTEVAQLEIDDTLDVERDIINNNFRAIKFRAGGKTVQYNLGEKIGLQILKEYLELRNFVLGDRKCNFLFFQLGRAETKDDISQHTERTIRKAHTRTEGVFFKLGTPTVTARDVRKFKSVVLHELRVETQKIGESLNHKSSTNLKHYIPHSPQKQEKEFSDFWSAIHKAAKEIPIIDVTSKHEEVSIPLGHCSNKNNPVSTCENPPVEPDCKKQYGCLFCNQFLIHADREDAHKLLSVKFVIEQVLLLADDENHAEKLLREIVVRIDYLIERLKAFSSEVDDFLEKLRVDVFDYGELTPFWAFRLARYEQMGML